MSDERYTRDFAVYEFASPDGLVPSQRMDPVFMTRLQALRDLWGEPLIITSGIRSPEHNLNVGGVPNSQHLLGLACDIDTSDLNGYQRWLFLSYAFSLGFKGIGITDDFIHLDMRDGLSSTWTY